ncbi:putative heparinase superfamily protein [Candidatus Hepatincolaceae symbiont of Richtersius coronifer]
MLKRRNLYRFFSKYVFNNILTLFWSFPIYKVLFLKKKYKFDFDKIRFNQFDNLYIEGHNILYGEIELLGKKYDIDNLQNTYNLPPKIFNELQGFRWLLHLKSLNTQAANDKAIYFFDSWVSNNRVHFDLGWELNILAERVSNWLICGEFFKDNKDILQRNKILASLNLQIAHLIKVYKIYFIEDKIKIFKAIILIYLATNVRANKINEVIELLNNNIKENIFHDGGHISRSPSYTLSYLEDLLIIYYSIKDNSALKHTLIRKHIDKLAVFIRTMRHSNGSLAVFNGGHESTKLKIDYLLSLSEISSPSSYYLRNSGFITLKTKFSSALIDVGKSSKENNSSLSLEIAINQNKIITNSVTIDPLEGNYGNLAQRLENSCLVLKVKGKILYFDLSNPNEIKIERRTEDNWEIINVSYTGLKDYGINYHKTIYISKNNSTYILGEDLLSFQNSAHPSLQEAFLRFHFHPQIKSIALYKKGFLALFEINEDNYFFSSIDNKMEISKSYYKGYEGNRIKSYTIDIPFNLSSKIIKNEWSISLFKDINS